MVAEIGLFSLILALFVSAVQATVPLAGAALGDRAWMSVDRSASAVLFALVSLSFGALVWLHVTSDFSVMNVVENSHTDKPLIYKITGVWGNHEGSMLLWTFILALYGFSVSIFGRNLPPALRARALSIQALIAFAFILFILLTSNPFVRVDPAPPNGNGLNPLLQDPGLAIHPPFLYLGYVGFSMAYSFAIAALIEGRVDAAWARWVRPWTLAAWCALTLGIALGSWWSYYTLGWGGYWAWDPVENASLMPWLAGTALLHSSIVAEKRDTMKSWTIFLSIIAFSLSLLGTFLVRSGVLTSVHSFAADPARGVFILTLLVGFTGGSLLLYAFRAPSLKGGGLFTPVSREGGLLFNNVVLSAAAGTVLLGTLYPLFMDALGLGKVSVGAPYFNMVMGPLMAPLILVMAVGPLLSWKRGNMAEAFKRLRFTFLAALVTFAVTLAIAGLTRTAFLAGLGLGLAAWLFFGSLAEFGHRIHFLRGSLGDSFHRALHLPRSAYGMTLAHAGLALLIVGVVGSQAWKSEYLGILRPGQGTDIAGYHVQFSRLEGAVPGPNYTAARATFVVSKGDRDIAVMQPERRMYNNPPRPLSTVAIHTNLVNDLYAVLGEADADGGQVVHVFHNPLVPWLFIGAVLMVLGGLVSLSDRRHRVGAPVRKLVPQQALAGAGARAPVPPATSASAAKKSPRSFTYLIPLTAFAVLVGFFGWRLHLIEMGNTPNLIPSVMIDKPAPQFDLPPLYAGQPGLSTADLKNHVTLVNFFASWCGPCREEHALLSTIPRNHLRLVGINYKDEAQDAKAWLGTLGNPYSVIAADRAGRTGIDFGVYGVPETYLIDKNGKIRFKQTGPLTPEIIRDQLAPLAEKLDK